MDTRELEPVSPELCLVDPELAQAMRERLPEPAEPEPESAPLRAPTPGARRRPAAPPRPPRLRRSAPRLPAALPRVAVAAASLVAIALLGSSTSVHGAVPANSLIDGAPAPAAAARVLVVPDVCRFTYVFAKGALEDAGFAWKVEGKVEGFAASSVARQLPGPGTVILTRGTPTITLTLARNTAYTDRGVPDNRSPYSGSTPVTIGAAEHVGPTDCERVSGGRMPFRPDESPGASAARPVAPPAPV